MRIASPAAPAAESTNAAAPDWLARPLSLADALNLALQQNSSILKGKSDMEAAHGLVVQTKAIAIPKLRATSDYSKTEAIERFPAAFISARSDQKWNAGIRLSQSIYEGGRINSALRTARLSHNPWTNPWGAFHP